MLLTILIIYLLSITTGTIGSEIPIINTSQGRVQGLVKQYDGTDVLQFKRIPFATPPIGQLRFEKPEPHEKWDKVLNATEFGPSCIQNFFENDAWLLDNTGISEDCLHLNIFVPRAINKMAPKAVMVWIHGGGFTAGQGTLYDGSYLALYGDVIVVTINYRLGLLGFMSTEDDNASGNFGIWDQKMAIEWVHGDVANFGGDKNRITIFGESAGGYSVGLHSIISSNKGHFQRAISQSGSVYSPRALAKDSRRVAIQAGNLLNCSTNNTSQLVDCLKSKTATEILNVQSDAINGWDKTETFVSRLGPVVDGNLIIHNPIDLLTDTSSESYKFFQSLDVIAGTNNAEGGLMYWSMMKYQDQYNFNISEGIPKEVLCEVLATTASKSYFGNNNEVTQAICERYSVPGDSLSEQGREAVNVYADVQFIIPAVRTLLAHVSKNQSSGSYQYIFTHQPSYPWIQSRPPWLQGANHAGEVPFVFGLEAMYPKSHSKPSSETELSKQIMTYWSNFAKSGNPNSDTLPDWPKFNIVNRSYMNLTVMPKQGQQLHKRRVKFWTETLPAFSSLVVNTTNGHVHGVVKYVNESTVVQFRGIPYAMPPTGDRRFAKPVPRNKWEYVYNATEFGPSCTQNIPSNDLKFLENKNISEDCLQLNMYVPRFIDPKVPKAVMIWIHGGGYYLGQGQMYDGSYLALHGNVIVVTINYRLGILGFMSTEDENALGNYGLWDQKMAIEWVYNNAIYFGGDRNRITLFGESAGGYSVGLQTTIPSNKGFFQRAILQSGTASSPRALAMDSKRVSKEAGRLLNCPLNSTEELVECLRQKPARELLKIQNEAAYNWDKSENIAMRLGPIVDGDLIARDPRDLLDDTNSEAYKFYRSLDMLAGTNNAEGGLMLSRINKYQKVYNFNISDGLPREILCEVVAPSAAETFFNNDSKISEAICNQYSTSKGLDEQGRNALDVYADLLFIVPTVKALLKHAGDKPKLSRHSYQYIFTHKPSGVRGLPQWLLGASHGYEVSFVFGLNTLNDMYSAEANISRLMMSFWSNFAKTGDPNQGFSNDESTEDPFWPTFDKTDKAFMNLTVLPHAGTHLYSERVNFWMETIPDINRKFSNFTKDVSTKSTKDTNAAFEINGSVGVLLLTSVCVNFVSTIVN